MTTYIHMAWKSQGLKNKSFIQEKRNADLVCFQGPFNKKEDTQTSNENTAVVIIPYLSEVCDVAVNKPFREWYFLHVTRVAATWNCQLIEQEA